MAKKAPTSLRIRFLPSCSRPLDSRRFLPPLPSVAVCHYWRKHTGCIVLDLTTEQLFLGRELRRTLADCSSDIEDRVSDVVVTQFGVTVPVAHVNTFTVERVISGGLHIHSKEDPIWLAGIRVYVYLDIDIDKYT